MVWGRGAEPAVKTMSEQATSGDGSGAGEAGGEGNMEVLSCGEWDGRAGHNSSEKGGERNAQRAWSLRPCLLTSTRPWDVV